MAYGLPAHGQQNWDDGLNNSVSSVKSDAAMAQSTANAAQASAAQAATDATAAKGMASLALDFVRQTTNGAISAAMAGNLARNPDLVISGSVTRDANGAATSAPVVWPDGTPGTYTADTLSAAFPGAVDAYHITYGSPVIRTYAQPAVTRDPSTGAATNVPAITVS